MTKPDDIGNVARTVHYTEVGTRQTMRRIFISLSILLLTAIVACAQGTPPGDFEGETTATPDTGKGDSITPAVCGDGACGVGESCGTCAQDCGRCQEGDDVCGDFVCGPVEDCGSCPSDCGECGGESPSTGSTGAGGNTSSNTTSTGSGMGGAGADPQDGPICGDDFCDPPEDDQSCPQDCETQSAGTCDHGVCEVGGPLDSSCNLCTTIVCGIDSFCCDSNWDDLCVDAADVWCGCS